MGDPPVRKRVTAASHSVWGLETVVRKSVLHLNGVKSKFEKGAREGGAEGAGGGHGGGTHHCRARGWLWRLQRRTVQQPTQNRDFPVRGSNREGNTEL